MLAFYFFMGYSVNSKGITLLGFSDLLYCPSIYFK